MRCLTYALCRYFSGDMVSILNGAHTAHGHKDRCQAAPSGHRVLLANGARPRVAPSQGRDNPGPAPIATTTRPDIRARSGPGPAPARRAEKWDIPGAGPFGSSSSDKPGPVGPRMLNQTEHAKLLAKLTDGYAKQLVAQRDFVHHEAFALMWYATEDNKHRERIWNSRNGVTPFSVTSKRGEMMIHVEWNRDVTSLRHRPQAGDRIFVDFTPLQVIKDAIDHVERFWAHPDYPMVEVYGTQAEAVAALATRCMDPGPQPHLVLVDEEMVERRGWKKEPAKPCGERTTRLISWASAIDSADE